MSTARLLDPELAFLQQPLLPDSLSAQMLPALRTQMGQNVSLADPASFGVARSEVECTSSDGTPVPALLYRPKDAEAGHPGYVHIHGGGYIIGSAAASDASNLAIASRLGVTVLSVDYRLAPEHPIPAPLEDCYAGLAWLHQNAPDLGIDTRRIGIGGESAGGGLAAALAILARDRGQFAVCHQHLTYPMLDNLTGSEAQPGDPLVGEFVWTRAANQFGWTSYLGDAEPTAPQVPARVEDCGGLPSTWMFTAALDLFRDENLDYAQRLLAAGIATEVVLYPGACHGFQMVAESAVSKRFVEDHLQALGRGLGVQHPRDG